MNGSLLHLALAVVLMVLSQCANAQYAWIDDKGTHVFSDRPPPPGTAVSRILKTPQNADAGNRAPLATGTPSSIPADRNADAQKRLAEQQAAIMKQRLQASLDRLKTDVCDMVGQQQAQLTSRAPIGAKDENGHMHYMSDQDRARLVQRGRELIARCNER